MMRRPKELKNCSNDVLHVDCMVRVRGNSMAPEILDGDIVFFQYTMPTDGQVAFVEVYDDITVKRVRYLPDGIRLESNNPEYPPLVIDSAEDIRIIGVMAGLVRLIKENASADMALSTDAKSPN